MLCKCSVYKTLSHNGFSIYCISKPDLWLAPARHWMRNFWICGEGISQTPEGFPSDGGLYQGHWGTGRIGHDRASCTRSSDVLACFCSHGQLTVMVTAVKPALHYLTGAKVGCRRAELWITLRHTRLASMPKWAAVTELFLQGWKKRYDKAVNILKLTVCMRAQIANWGNSTSQNMLSYMHTVKSYDLHTE